MREHEESVHYLTTYSGMGPEWGPDIAVDVVLGLNVPANHDSLSFVRFTGVTILRLD